LQDIIIKMEEKIYPLYYKGKFWEEEEVNDVFRAFYHTKMSLDHRTSVYVSEGLRITPEGDWIE
jgi:hypothetical protein